MKGVYLDDWKPPTEGIRLALLEGNIWMHEHLRNLLESDLVPFDRVAALNGIKDAARYGRLFDIGMMIVSAEPPPALEVDRKRDELKRAVELFRDGYISHPFSDPYVIVLSDYKEDKLVLLVIPVPDARIIYVAAGNPFRVNGKKCLVVHLITKQECPLVVNPRAMGIIVWADPSVPDDVKTDLSAKASGFTLDTILMLATKNLEVRPVNKLKRLKLPPHFSIDGKAYVTALRNANHPSVVSDIKHGTHASPVPHVRRGHIRRLPSGDIWIRDTFVNMIGNKEMLDRNYYDAGKGKPNENC